MQHATLAERLAAIKAGSRLPAEDRAVMERASEVLGGSGLLAGLPKLGDRELGFALPDDTGGIVASSSLLSQGPLVVNFYRGVWCPYCNADLTALNEALPRIRTAGAGLVAISPQTFATSRKARRDSGLDIPVLRDERNEVAVAYPLRFRLAPEVQAIYQRLGIDLAHAKGDHTWTLPCPPGSCCVPTRSWLAPRPIRTKRAGPSPTRSSPCWTSRPRDGEPPEAGASAGRTAGFVASVPVQRGVSRRSADPPAVRARPAVERRPCRIRAAGSPAAPCDRLRNAAVRHPAVGSGHASV